MIIKSCGFFATLAIPLMAQGLFKASAIGHSQGLLQPGATAGKVKTISSSSGDAGIGPGKIENGVNLLTGQPYYSIPLGSITARTVGYPIVLTYSGNTKSIVDQDNERAPTSWVGLGFNLSFPFVATNHKGTYTSSDDVIFCNLGPYGGGQILLDSAGTRYYVSSNPYIKVAFDTAVSGEYANQFTKWAFTFPDGKKMVFGQDTNAQRYVLYSKGLIKASRIATDPAKKFIYRWDLRSFYDTIPNQSPRNILTFEYERMLDSGATQKFYVREGYIKNIKWMEGSQEVERYEFKTAAKASNEYEGYGPFEPRDDQKLFETRRLDTLKCYKEGTLVHFYKFDWITQRKGLLSKIKVYHPHPVTATAVQDSGWTFAYDSGKFFLLNSVVTPSARKDSLEYTQFSFWGTEGDQDPSDRVMLRADNVSEIPLPSDTADLVNWTLESNCDERFCYTVVWDADNEYLPGDTTANGLAIREKMYVEIKRNLGNYFDSRSVDNSVTPYDTITARFEVGYPTTPASAWKFIPAGNYVLLVNELAGTVLLYEYDGVRWMARSPFTGDTRWNGTNFGSPITVHPAPNYFLVQKKASPYEIIVAIRKATGWISLNRNASLCDFHNKGSYGESIRPGSGGCLEWTRASLKPFVSPHYFGVVDSLTSVVNIFALKNDQDGFEDISQKFGVASHPSDLQMSGKPMNWDWRIISVYPSSDYFLVHSKPQSGSATMTGFYFNGDTLSQIAWSTIDSTGAAFTSDRYFLTVDPSTSKISYWERRQSETIDWFIYQDAVRSDFNPAWKLLIRTHPSAFTVEYYEDMAGFGLRPHHQDFTTKYQSHLYQVNRAFEKGFKDRTSEFEWNSHRLFNVSFSGSDNMLISTHGRKSTGALCNENINFGECIISHITARFHPDDTASFIHAASGDIQFVTFNTDLKAQKQSHLVMSNAARLGMGVVLDTTGSSKRVRCRGYQYDGKGFSQPDSQYVVDRVISMSSLTADDKNKVTHQFYYTPFSQGTSEFNSNLQSPQFELTDRVQVKTDYTELGLQRTFFNLDAQATPLSGRSSSLIGLEKYSRTMASNGDTTLYMNSMSEPYRHPTWPKPLYLPRQKAAYSQIAARNQSRMTDTTSFHNYCDTNGLPHFTLQKNGLEKIILSQSYFDGLGFPKQTAVYRLFTEPNLGSLETQNPTTPYSYTGLISGSKARYEGYYFQEDSLWREADQNLTDQDLKAGTTPTFRIDEGWLPGTKVTQRDTANFFQVLETKGVKSKVAGGVGEIHTSFFYEGRRSDPVATVGNAKLANCAILLGEDGNADLGGLLDHRGKWENPGTVLSSARSHTGRYGVKVTDNYGPTVNLFLKDVRERKLSFRVSAWIYADGGAPQMIVERRQYNGSFVDLLSGSPLTGNAATQGKWQRWEANLTYDQLTAGGLFNGNSDYLRIWIGTGAPSGNGANILYVDDIVCLPGNATFSLQTFNARGAVTSVTDATHQTVFYDIGFKGQVMAVRDEKSRIFGQGALHRMGEN